MQESTHDRELAQIFEDLNDYIDDSLLDIDGSVYYSGANSFEGHKRLYILGLNPGGGESGKNIKWYTTEYMQGKESDYSEYKESWCNKEAGSHGLQPRVLHLLKTLDLCPFNVPTSNLIFTRTRQEKDLPNIPNLEEVKNKTRYLADLCWPFHKAVINKLGVKMILCFGATAGSYVASELKAEYIDEYKETNNRGWKTRIYKNSNDLYVVSAAHPSRANWCNKLSDPSNKIKEYFDKIP